jgi:SAM-dependent methyltransferase
MVYRPRPSVIRRAVEIIRSAPSTRDGVKEIVQKAVGRLPAWRRKTVRAAKTAYWQSDSEVEHFVRETDAAKVAGAAYMDGVINDFFARNCPKGSSILDVGCGNGIVTLFLARRGCSVTACDISEPMLRELNRNRAALDVKVRRGDAYDLPFGDAMFDRVVARMFLYHFPDWPRVLAEMARCCRPGGRLLIHITSKENADLARRECKVSFAMCDLPERGKFGRDSMQWGEFDARSISAAARRCGLRVVERVPCTFFHSNPLINFSIGAERSDSYRNQLQNWLSKPDVLAFAKWFEESAVQQMPVWISYYNLLVLEKL